MGLAGGVRVWRKGDVIGILKAKHFCMLSRARMCFTPVS